MLSIWFIFWGILFYDQSPCCSTRLHRLSSVPYRSFYHHSISVVPAALAIQHSTVSSLKTAVFSRRSLINNKTNEITNDRFLIESNLQIPVKKILRLVSIEVSLPHRLAMARFHSTVYISKQPIGRISFHAVIFISESSCVSLSLTVKSFSPVYLSALFFLFLFSIWTDGALFLPFAAWHCIIIPVQAALSLNAGCSTLQSAEITRQSLHQCVGLASCCCREAAADFRSRCLTARITSQTMLSVESTQEEGGCCLPAASC